jgi:hypothetical protein
MASFHFLFLSLFLLLLAFFNSLLRAVFSLLRCCLFDEEDDDDGLGCSLDVAAKTAKFGGTFFASFGGR